MLLVAAESVVSGLSGSCSSDFKICAPAGTKTDSLGPIGSAWGDLFNNIVDVVSNYGISHPAAATIDASGPARREQAFCCQFSCRQRSQADQFLGSNVADCLLVPVVDIAMCWVRLNMNLPQYASLTMFQDRFTTNVYFPDGTYGTVVTGDFNTSDGTSINLVYGDYTMKNGTKGNIYNGDVSVSAKPDTTTMPMPSPWTSKGEGSAIPATGLGTTASLSVVTTTISATSFAASTGSSITVIATMTGCNHCPAYNTTIPGPTQPGGTHSARTSTFTTGIITPTITGSIGTSLTTNMANILIAFIIGVFTTHFLTSVRDMV